MEIVINSEIFCRNLRYLRRKQKLSQKKLAEMMGISVYSLRNMESGKYETVLSYQKMKMLCSILEVSVEKLLHSESLS